MVVQTQVVICRKAAFDVTEDVQISKVRPETRARARAGGPNRFQGDLGARNIHHLRVGRVATAGGPLSPCYLFYGILIQRDEHSGDRNSLFMRR